MKTILILEDDLDLASHWRMWLEGAGHRVIHQTDVKGAIHVVDSREIDLVICDILIGNHTAGFSTQGGLSMLSHIMLHTSPRPKSLIITGAKPSLSIDRHVQLLKADRFVSKPISEGSMLAEVSQLLTQPKQTSNDPPGAY